jgi:hypothetical protein
VPEPLFEPGVQQPFTPPCGFARPPEPTSTSVPPCDAPSADARATVHPVLICTLFSAPGRLARACSRDGLACLHGGLAPWWGCPGAPPPVVSTGREALSRKNGMPAVRRGPLGVRDAPPRATLREVSPASAPILTRPHCMRALPHTGGSIYAYNHLRGVDGGLGLPSSTPPDCTPCPSTPCNAIPQSDIPTPHARDAIASNQSHRPHGAIPRRCQRLHKGCWPSDQREEQEGAQVAQALVHDTGWVLDASIHVMHD